MSDWISTTPSGATSTPNRVAKSVRSQHDTALGSRCRDHRTHRREPRGTGCNTQQHDDPAQRIGVGYRHVDNPTADTVAGESADTLTVSESTGDKIHGFGLEVQLSRLWHSQPLEKKIVGELTD